MKIKKLLYSAAVIIFFYFLLKNFLFRIDGIPRWGQINCQQTIAINRSFEVTVKYKVETAGRLLLKVVFLNQQGLYRSEKHLIKNIPVIYGSGESRFRIILSSAEVIDKDIAKISIIASRHEVPKDINKSIYECKMIGRAVESKLIQIVKPNPDGTLPGKNIISSVSIMKKAINEGLWSRYAGDFNFTGWFITAVYFIVFILCLLHLKKLLKLADRNLKVYKYFWIFLTVCVFLLGVNKQLDIQLLIADFGRTYSQAHGWYNTRRTFQIEFFAISAAVALGLLLIIWNALKNIWKNVFIAVAGLCILFGFILVKATSIHLLEHYFHKRFGGFNLFGISEIAGLFCILLSVIVDNRRLSRSH